MEDEKGHVIKGLENYYVKTGEYAPYGFTCGTYDLLHAGHVLALRDAYYNCSRLIVGLQTDPTVDRPEKNKPVQSLVERYIQLEACRYVHKVWVYTTEAQLYDFLERGYKSGEIERRFLGEDWLGKNFTGCDIPLPVTFTPRRHNYSSTELRRRIKDSPV